MQVRTDGGEAVALGLVKHCIGAYRGRRPEMRIDQHTSSKSIAENSVVNSKPQIGRPALRKA